VTITKEQAIKFERGKILHHKTLKNKDGTPYTCEVSGDCLHKEEDPKSKAFMLPVNMSPAGHLFGGRSYISNINFESWYDPEWKDEIGLVTTYEQLYEVLKIMKETKDKHFTSNITVEDGSELECFAAQLLFCNDNHDSLDDGHPVIYFQ
jgi:hypothetical protein